MEMKNQLNKSSRIRVKYKMKMKKKKKLIKVIMMIQIQQLKNSKKKLRKAYQKERESTNQKRLRSKKNLRDTGLKTFYHGGKFRTSNLLRNITHNCSKKTIILHRLTE